MPDAIDAAQLLEQRQREDFLRRARARIARDAALLDAGGRPGECITCYGAIAPERLAAVPHAVRCTACQAVHEKLSRAR